MATHSSSSILGVIQHYQRNIERCQSDESRLLHCIEKLYHLPVKVDHLQETGIGKTVNSLRKFNGEIGVAAKALVTKWKAMVAAEEEPVEQHCQVNEDETNNGKDSSDEDQYDQNRNSAAGAKEPQHSSNGNQKVTEQHSSKERSRHKHRQEKESGSSGSNSRQAHHSDKLANAEAVSKQKSSSSRSQSQNQEHNHSEKRETEKHHKSREREQRTEHREKEHGKDKDKNARRKEDKKQRDEAEKEESISPSSSQHKRKRETSENPSTKEQTGNDKKSKHKESERSAHSSSSRDKGKQEHKSRSKKETPEKQKSSSKETEQRDKNKSAASSRSSSSKPSTSAAAAALSERRSNLDAADEGVIDIKSPESKVVKTEKSSKKRKQDEEVEPEADDGIDSSMGANFADVLGMLNMPTKKSKKSLNHSKSPISGSSKSGSSKETSNTSKVNGIKPSASASISTYASTSASTSKRSPDKKPELLSSSAKLEPLDPSIVLELPTISNNYKPLPLNQTIMDCVFNTSNSSSSKAPPLRTLTDTEALSHGISSKTMRTKIYSGVRTGQIHQVPSLFDLCIRVLQKNIDALEYTGGVPFEVLRSVLERATPHQLLVFEEYNPYLMEDSDVLWQQHVQRQYRTQKRLEMESWREMFLRCQEAQERKLNILAESIKQSQKVIAAPVRKTQLAFVDSFVKPPRNVQRKQEQYGTKSKLIATPAARVAALSSVTPNAAKSGDVRLRVAAGVRDAAQVSHGGLRVKKAPLMAKTLQFMRGRHKR